MRLFRHLMALGLAVLAVCLVAFSMTGQVVDRLIYDRVMAMWPMQDWPATLKARPILIKIDEASLQRLGHWPWSRKIHADLIRLLGEAGVAAIGYNVAFVGSDPLHRAADQALADALMATDRVVSPAFAAPGHGKILPFYVDLPGGHRIGHVHIGMDSDALVRRVFLYAGPGRPQWPILALAALQRAQGQPSSLPGQRSPVRQIEFENRWGQDHEVLIPFKTGGLDLLEYSFVDVLDGTAPQASLRDRVVFVGLTATGFEQKFLAYVDGRRQVLSGTEIQAHVYKALVEGEAVSVLPLRWGLLLAAVVAVLVFVLLWRDGLTPRFRRRGLAIIGLLLIAVPGIALYCKVWLAVAPAIAALVALLAGWGVWQVKLLDTSARRDPLTGLANRRMFDETLAAEWEVARRRQTTIALLLIDIDYFKQFNDRFGHSRGDWALVRVAGILPQYSRRARDLAARYGGEEFAIILPEAGPSQASAIAWQLCKKVASLNISHPGSEVAPVLTLSVGVASVVPAPEQRSSSLVQQADLALYRAKSEGRNRIHLAN